MWILLDHLTELRMFLGLVYGHDAFEGNLEECIAVLDRSKCSDANKPTFKVGRILLVGINDSVLGAPIIEDFALP